MRIIRIAKRNGKFRTIYIPSRERREELRGLLPELAELFDCRPSSRAAHGFCKDRSPVTNALEHVNKDYTVTFDLRDFFDTVTDEMLAGLLPQRYLDQVLVDGAARQGLPTSPAVANLAAVVLDQAILRWCRVRAKEGTVYTRYADDLTVSTNSEQVKDEALRDIPQFVEMCGFQLAAEKTHVYSAKAGRRIITGVAVDGGIHPTRAVKRRLRAALHQGNNSRARGLREWCRLRLPKRARQAWLQRLQEEYGRGARHLNLHDMREDLDLADAADATPSVPVVECDHDPNSTVDAAGRTRRIQLR